MHDSCQHIGAKHVNYSNCPYIFLQDKDKTVWQIDHIRVAGIFKKKMAISIHSKDGTKRTCSVVDFRETDEDDVVKYLAMAGGMASSLAGPLSILFESTRDSAFLWTPYTF